MLRVNPAAHDPYDTKFYRAFDRLLAAPAAMAVGRRGRRRGALCGGIGGNGSYAPEFLPVARQALFPCRRAAARGVQYPGHGTQPAHDGGVASCAARGEDRLGDDGFHAAALLPGQQQRFAAPQFREHPRRTARQRADRSCRGAFQRLCPGDVPRRVAALVAFQTLARARCGDRIRVYRRRYRHAPPPDAGRRRDHVADGRHGQHPQQLGQPRPDMAAALLADEGAAYRRHPQPDGAGHHHRHAGLPPRRIPRGRPVHADPSEGREYRHLQPHQPAGTADFHPRRQGLLHRAGDRRLPLRIPRRSGETLQPSAGHEGAVRPRPRGQHHAALRCAAGFGSARRGAPRRVFDEGFRRAGEPAGIQLGPGQVYAPDDGAYLHRAAPAFPQLPRAGRHPADDPADLHRRGARTGRHGQGLQLLLPAGTAGVGGHEHQERRGAGRTGLPHHIYGRGTLQADASLRIARRFSESLADYNLESILFLVGRNSYHYPPQMILAKDLRKSIHSYKDSLRMRTGTDSFLTK